MNNKYLTLGLIVVLFAAGVFTVLKFFGGGSWVCQNGEWVKKGSPIAPMPTIVCGEVNLSPSPAGNPNIRVFAPSAGEIVRSPFLLKGEARGNWYFEASFPIKLLADDGQELVVEPVQAKGEWMTTDFVPFEHTVEYHVSATTSAALVLHNDNPSDRRDLDQEIRVPIVLTPTDDIAVKVYFNNNRLDPDVSCNKVFAVDRAVFRTQSAARAALEELLKGPTRQEARDGYSTNINSGVKIQRLAIENGVAKVDFNEALENGVGGSCRVSAIRAQIIATLKQFSSVKDVLISIDGETDLILQP